LSLIRKEDGIWQIKLKLEPGIYHYRFIVDGEWCDDPECTLRILNEFGTSNMLRKVLTF
jgi:hypothetical protein